MSSNRWKDIKAGCNHIAMKETIGIVFFLLLGVALGYLLGCTFPINQLGQEESLPPDWLFKSQAYPNDDLPTEFIGSYTQENIDKLEYISENIGLFGIVPIMEGLDGGEKFQVFIGRLGYTDFLKHLCKVYPEDFVLCDIDADLENHNKNLKEQLYQWLEENSGYLIIDKFPSIPPTVYN